MVSLLAAALSLVVAYWLLPLYVVVGIVAVVAFLIGKFARPLRRGAAPLTPPVTPAVPSASP